MPNDVYRAIDATLVLGVEDASLPEGTVADALVSEYDLSNTVGRLHQVSVSVLSDVKPYYEIGRRYPTHLRPGVVRVSGSAERAHVNGALLRLLLGEGALSPPGAPTSSSRLSTSWPAFRTPRGPSRWPDSPCSGRSSTAGTTASLRRRTAS
jgi:hypothetical protein